GIGILSGCRPAARPPARILAVRRSSGLAACRQAGPRPHRDPSVPGGGSPGWARMRRYNKPERPALQRGIDMTVALSSLWLPILLSAVAVFIASALIWAVVQWHNADWQKLPDEEAARRALQGVPPGDYILPHAASNKERQSPEWQQKFKEGPAAMVTGLPHGSMAMGKQFLPWIGYTLILSLLVGYVAGGSLPAGTE